MYIFTYVHLPSPTDPRSRAPFISTTTSRRSRTPQRCALLPSLPFLTTLVLYISTTVFTGAALHAAFTASSQEAAAAQALSDCDPLAYFSPVSVQEDGDRMNCVQTATLLINVRIP